MYPRFAYALIGMATAWLLLSACVPQIVSSPATKPPDPQAEQAALVYAQQGDYLEAARRYLALAEYSGISSYRMTGVEYLLRVNREADAKVQLAKIQIAKDDNALRARFYLAHTALALANNQPDFALANLAQAEQLGVPSAYSAPLYAYRAQIAEAKGDYINAAKNRADLDQVLVNGFEKQSNQERLWQNLVRHTGPLPMESGQNAWSGWLALARLSQNTPANFRSSALQQWRGQYPNHGAEYYVVRQWSNGTLAHLPPSPNGSLANTITSGLTQPYATHIALLLPQEGKYAAPAKAVQDGFAVAWYAQTQGQYPVRVYPGDQANVLASYQTAVQKGAKLVVGPLEKEAVAQLAQNAHGLGVATVFLNVVNENAVAAMAPQVYEFSLAPEDEARLLAEQAWREGHTHAGVLYPNTPKGERLLQAFQRFFAQQGGQISEYASYEKDYTAPTAAIAKAYQNKRISILFLIAQPQDARQLKPMLDYHLAQDLPILALGQIYAGQPSAHYDGDLDGIRFVEMPWLFPDSNLDMTTYQTIASSEPASLQHYTRLVAFGVDAFRVASAVLSGAKYGLEITGACGKLALNSINRFYRQNLVWAKFENGVPVILSSPYGQASSLPTYSQ